jgi:hypothetical protein
MSTATKILLFLLGLTIGVAAGLAVFLPDLPAAPQEPVVLLEER